MRNSGIWRASYVFIEKISLINGAVLFRGQLNSVPFLHIGRNVIKMLLHPVFFEGASLPGEKTHGICNLVMCPSVRAANDDARWPSHLLERVPACLRDGDGGFHGGREAHFLGLVPSNRTSHSLDY